MSDEPMYAVMWCRNDGGPMVRGMFVGTLAEAREWATSKAPAFPPGHWEVYEMTPVEWCSVCGGSGESRHLSPDTDPPFRCAACKATGQVIR